MYTYQLPQMPKSEFKEFNNFVRACFDQSKARKVPELKRIDVHVKGHHPRHVKYIEKFQPLAVTVVSGKDMDTAFSIWVNPAYRDDTFKFRMTLAHELAHGYAGVKYGHSAHWRRWFYRVMWHLDSAEFLPEHEDPLSLICFASGHLYNHSDKSERHLVEEAFEQADREHKDVLDSYWERTTCQR